MKLAAYAHDREYVLHRQRMMRTESVVASRGPGHADAPSALTSHKSFLRSQQIARENEGLHRRLVKLQVEESPIVRDIEGFAERFVQTRGTMGRNRLLARLTREGEVLEANERMHARILRSGSVYPQSQQTRWYKGQVRPLGQRPPARDAHCPRALLPAPLPREPPLRPFSEDCSRLSSTGTSRGRGRDRGRAGAGSQSSSIATSSGWEDALDEGVYVSLLPPQMQPAMHRRVRRRRPALPPLNLARTPEESTEAPSACEAEAEEQTRPAGSRPGTADEIAYMDEGEGATIGGEPAHSYTKVLGWEFAIPLDARNCIVNAHLPLGRLEEHLYLCTVAACPPYRKLSEKRVGVDELFDVIETVRALHQLVDEDGPSLRLLLQSIFLQADEDRSGHLSFSEVQTLLDQINLGLSAADLRSIVAEADVDDSGFVDYEEFVPIALDMIMGYRARSRANVHGIDAAVFRAVHASINAEEVESLAALCMHQFRLSDPQQTGFLSYNLFKTRLSKAGSAGLTPNDIRLLCLNVPRDYRGRCLYGTFKEVLYDVRFMAANNRIIEAQGSGLTRHIIELCLAEERRLAALVETDESIDSLLNGSIPLRSLVDVLLSSPQLSLNRLQAMLLTSEANVVKGRVSIYQFVPACVKTIEMMFDPVALRMRAELLASEDVSTEALLDGHNRESFKERMQQLFDAADFDHSGALDLEEFCSCVASLGLEVSRPDMEALFSLQQGPMSLDDFSTLVSTSLLDLVRERRIRAIEEKGMLLRRSVVQASSLARERRASALLAMYFPDGSVAPCLSLEQASAALQTAASSLGLDADQTDMLLAEVDPLEGGATAAIVDAHAAMLLSFEQSASTKEAAETAAAVVAHELHLLNAGVSLEALEQGFRQADLASIDERGCRQLCLRALHASGTSRVEAHHMLRLLCTTDASRAPSSAAIKAAWLSARRLSLIRGLLDSQRPSETVALLHQRLERQLKETPHTNEVLPPSLSLRRCLSCLRDLSELRLTQREVLHALFAFDSYDAGVSVSKARRMAEGVAGAMRLFRSQEGLRSVERVLDHLRPLASTYMHGLTRPALLQFLAMVLPAQGSPEGDELSERQLLKVLPDLPLLVMTEKEMHILVATLPVNERGNVLRCSLDALLFGQLERVRWARTFARRLALLPPEGEESQQPYLASMQRLMERLLNAVKLENWNGNVRVTFPDMSARLLKADSDDEALCEGGAAEETARVRVYSRVLPVRGAAERQVAAAVTVTIETNLKRMAEASVLRIETLVGGAELRLVYPGVPSLAVVDEDLADEFIAGVLDGLFVEHALDKGQPLVRLAMFGTSEAH